MANDLSAGFDFDPDETVLHRPTSGAAPFRERELFFSRTDPRGVIQSGNTVFQRVSDHPWASLLNAPHKVIRHPDMPRAVFWLMWEAIKAGRPVGAYVKNLARDGLHYWVFAIVSPVQDGYLSVRLKPSAGILEQIEPHYAALRERERAQGKTLEPETSATHLLEALQGLGYANYDAFMSHALMSELNAHQNHGGKRRGPGAVPLLLAAVQELSALSRETAKLNRQLGDMTCTLVNMRLIASRIEGANGPISLMAQNYGTVLNEARAWLDSFATAPGGDLARISKAIRVGAFDYGAATVQRMVIQQFARESLPPEAGDKTRESALLEEEARKMLSVAADSVATIATSGRSLERAIQEVRRSCAGLNSTRMMCRAEAARLGNDVNFATIIDTLDESQNRIEAAANEVLTHSLELRTLIGKIAEAVEQTA